MGINDLIKLHLYSYISILERSKTARLKSGVLFTHLIRVGVLSLPDYCTGLEAVMQEAAELVIDIPGLWDCVAELIGKNYFLIYKIFVNISNKCVTHSQFFFQLL